MSVEVAVDVEGAEEFQAAVMRLDVNMQRTVMEQLLAWAEAVQARALDLVPRRTGYLASTIYAIVKDWVAEVGAEADYAAFVEFGTRYMMAQPYLHPAIEENLPDLEAMIAAGIEEAARMAGL